MGMYEWIAAIDRSLQQLWANGNCSSCKVQGKWELKSWTWSRAPGKARRETEGSIFRVLRKAAIFPAMMQCSGLLGGTKYRGRDAKVGLAGESWVLVPEGEVEQVSLYSWGRARTGLWICDPKATEPGLRNVTGSEGRITNMRMSARVAADHTCLEAPVLLSVTDALCSLGAFVTLNENVPAVPILHRE